MIVKDHDQYKLFIKGADCSILPLLTDKAPHPYQAATETALHDFSSVGLRTLVFGCRYFTETQYKEIEKLYSAAVVSMEKKQKLKQLMVKVEKDLVLLGCSAIKDHLQEKVPESITRFIQANIKVWMITGDKSQTAESIAYSAGIFQSDMEVFRLESTTKEEFPKACLRLKRLYQKSKPAVKKGILLDISMNSRLE